MSHIALNVTGGTHEGRISRSWRLTRHAWQVVRADPALLVLATFSGLLSVAGIALIFGVSDAVFAHDHFSRLHLAVATAIVAYPLTFFGVFFSTAIAAAASAALDGRKMSVGEALAVPSRRIGQVALWTLLVTVVGTVLNQLASRLPFLGGIAARVAGLGWALASLFAIPILAVDGCSAPDCLRRSASLVKQRWGEGISGNIAIGAWTVVIMLPLIIVAGVGLAAAEGTPAVQVGIVAVAAVLLLATVSVAAVVRQTFAVALYRYAETDTAQGPFPESDLRSPFSGKRRMFS